MPHFSRLSKRLRLELSALMMERFNHPQYIIRPLAGNVQFIAFLQIHPESSTHTQTQSGLCSIPSIHQLISHPDGWDRADVFAWFFLLMVVCDFNVKRTIFTVRPLKTKSPLPVNANTELTFSIANQRFKMVTR